MKKILGFGFAVVLGLMSFSSSALAGPGENDIVAPKPPIVVYGPGEND